MSIFWCSDALRILQRVEFALARGDRDFLRAQFGLRLLQAGLQRGLLALQAPLRRLIRRPVPGAARRASEFGNLIFAAEDGGGAFAVPLPFSSRRCRHRGG